MINVIQSPHCDAYEKINVSHNGPIKMISVHSVVQPAEEKTSGMYIS